MINIQPELKLKLMASKSPKESELIRALEDYNLQSNNSSNDIQRKIAYFFTPYGRSISRAKFMRFEEIEMNQDLIETDAFGRSL